MKIKTKKKATELLMLDRPPLEPVAARVHELEKQIIDRKEEVRRLKDLMDPLLHLGRNRIGAYTITKTHYDAVAMSFVRKAYDAIIVRKRKSRLKPLAMACLLALCSVAHAQTRNVYINERLPYALGYYPIRYNRNPYPAPPAPAYTFDGRWMGAATNLARIEASMQRNQTEHALLLRVNRTQEQEIRLDNLGKALSFQGARMTGQRQILSGVEAEYKLRDLKMSAVK